MGRSTFAGLAMALSMAGPGAAEPARTPGSAAPATQPPDPAPAPAAAQPATAATTPTGARPAPVVPSASAGPVPGTAGPGAVSAATIARAAPPEPYHLSDDPRPALTPDTFLVTMRAAERYRGIVQAGGWPVVPNEATRLKPGDRGDAVTILRRRLAVTGDLAEADRAGPSYDDAVAAAIRAFQRRHGLEETGTIGPRTLFHLNVSASDRLRQLQGSASRLMGSRFPFGERYVVVNIPSASVEAVSNGQVQRRFVAVVGKPDRPSPQVETRVTSINFNPTWTVPVSLIRKDIIPHVRRDPNYLAKMKIRLFDATGTEIDPGRVDWSTGRAANYTIRQDSGVDNSLGEVRIDMPNRHAVYMHDTPSKRLFARAMRAQSSGCVRVSGVKDLVAWLLEGTPGPGGHGVAWTPAAIQDAVESGRRIDARLTRPVPVAWVYLTGFATSDGTVQFRDDLYRLDEAAPAPPRSPDAKPVTMDELVTSSVGPGR